MSVNVPQKYQKIIVLSFTLMLALCYLYTRPAIDLPHIAGHKTASFFDLWSIEHLIGGLLLGTAFRSRGRAVHWWLALAMCMPWEAIEWSLEAGVFGSKIACWFSGEEHWTNRLISDPLLYVLGAYLGQRIPRYRYALAGVYVAWYVANILSPNAMYLQSRLVQLLP